MCSCWVFRRHVVNKRIWTVKQKQDLRGPWPAVGVRSAPFPPSSAPSSSSWWNWAQWPCTPDDFRGWRLQWEIWNTPSETAKMWRTTASGCPIFNFRLKQSVLGRNMGRSNCKLQVAWHFNILKGVGGYIRIYISFCFACFLSIQYPLMPF